MKAACRTPTRLLLIDWEGSAAGGVDPALCAAEVDGVVFCAYTQRPERIGPLLAEWRDHLGPDKTVVAGFQLFHPNVADGADLAARVAATRGLADGLNLYNLGLVPPARLRWMAQALRALSA
jgi:hypothetical protein